MSQLTKISWMVAVLSAVALFSTRYILGGWIDALYFPLVIFVLSTLVALFSNFKLYISFFKHRATKNSASTGAVFIAVLVILLGLNYFAVKTNKVYDLTKNKVFSLDPQSMSVVDNLESNINIPIYYRGSTDENFKNTLRDKLKTYTNYSKNISVESIDIYLQRERALEDLKDLENLNQPIVFVEYQNKKVRVEAPFTENEFTKAIIKATRSEAKKIYFTTGHGERDLLSEEPEGAASLKRSLEDSSYIVESIKLFELKKVPTDADVLAIVGPRVAFLEQERALVFDYIKSGGNLLLAIDPGGKHKGALISKLIGTEFKNNYIVSKGVQLQGRGELGALGMYYDPQHPVTSAFISSQLITLFDVSSELAVDPNISKNLQAYELIKSADESFALNDLNSAKAVNEGSLTLAIATEGKVDGATRPGRYVVIGDSDFLSEKDIVQVYNMPLVKNIFSYLTDEKDLIEVKPRQMTSTKLILTSVHQNTIVVFSLLMPILFAGLGFATWLRRRKL